MTKKSKLREWNLLAGVTQQLKLYEAGTETGFACLSLNTVGFCHLFPGAETMK